MHHEVYTEDYFELRKNWEISIYSISMEWLLPQAWPLHHSEVLATLLQLN